MDSNQGKKYLTIDSIKGYPAGSLIRYECANCGDIIESRPEHSVACRCRNIIVDSDSGRVSVKNADLFLVFEMKC